jgi:hypothetical protein
MKNRMLIGLKQAALWSAVTCHRFGRLRPVAAWGRLEFAAGSAGVKPPQTKALTGQRTPKSGNSLVEFCSRYRADFVAD